MFNKFLLLFFLLFSATTVCDIRRGSSDSIKLDIDYNLSKTRNISDCWLRLGAEELFDNLDKLYSEYAGALVTVQKYLDDSHFNEKMLKEILARRGAAYREITKANANQLTIPSGMHLGGRCMTTLTGSVLFFHRMKLCNDTRIRVNMLNTDIKNMVLRAHLTLNDLYLQGAYDRAILPNDPSSFYYLPSFGEIQVLLTKVQYKVEGHYRVIKKGLVIEHITSRLKVQDIIASFNITSKKKHVVRLPSGTLDEFLTRIRSDLNKWLKDYFNDYLLSSNFNNVPSFDLLEQYDKLRIAHLAAYTDSAIDMINERLKKAKEDKIQVPNFNIRTRDLILSFSSGKLHGLDTMYRRSEATTITKRDNIRHVDVTVGFSDLKIIYEYNPESNNYVTFPPVTNVMLTTNDISSHLTIGLLLEPEVVDIDIDYLEPLGPNSFSFSNIGHVESSPYKYLLEHHAFTIMMNTLNYGVAKLKSLPNCEYFGSGQV